LLARGIDVSSLDNENKVQADFEDVNLDDIDFDDAEFEGPDFDDADFEGPDFDEEAFEASDFEADDISPEELAADDIVPEKFRRTVNAEFEDIDLEDIDFDNAEFEDVDYPDTAFETAEFEGPAFDEDIEEADALENLNNKPVSQTKRSSGGSHEMTEISFGGEGSEADEDIFFDLSESVKEVLGSIEEEGEAEDEEITDVGKTIINDTLTHDVIRALKEQESGKTDDGRDLVDEAIQKMIKEDDDNE
jgi:hypothetical protein